MSQSGDRRYYVRRLRNSRVPHAGHAKTRSSASVGAGSLGPSSTRGQPRGKVVASDLSERSSRSRARGQSKPARSGTLAQDCVPGSMSPTLRFLQHSCLRSSHIASVRPAAPRHGRHGPFAAAHEQAGRLRERPAQVRVADLLAAAAELFPCRLVQAAHKPGAGQELSRRLKALPRASHTAGSAPAACRRRGWSAADGRSARCRSSPSASGTTPDRR